MLLLISVFLPAGGELQTVLWGVHISLRGAVTAATGAEPRMAQSGETVVGLILRLKRHNEGRESTDALMGCCDVFFCRGAIYLQQQFLSRV